MIKNDFEIVNENVWKVWKNKLVYSLKIIVIYVSHFEIKFWCAF